ncbi:MAG TPA: protein kinase [Gaiellaceae bacterium]|nr:protein kinase [Gaiellaceae bacterium]
MIGDVIAGRYDLRERVGTGGMSTVYKAHDRLLERTVALKVLHPQYGSDTEPAQRFRHEARAVAQLSHRNIVTVIDRGESDGRQFIVLEYVDGENLKQLSGRCGPLPVRQALELTLQIADGLAFAHTRGIVHRDVKPQNVLVDAHGNAKVTDFGIARSLDAEHAMTLTGTVLGTSAYLSPEQASGEPVTAATDVYALGVVLFELLTSEVPFPGENVVAVAMRHLHEPPPSLLERRRDVPLRLAAAVERALAKDPAQRFPSMEAFAAELRGCLAEPGGADEQPTLVVHAAPRPRRRRSRLPIVLALLGLVAALAAGGAYLFGGSGGGGVGPGGGGTDVTLRGITAYDPPPGDGKEHDAQAGLATDGSASTFWSTETYLTPAFGGLKDGIGLVLDADGAVALHTLTVSTDTPGFTAVIRAGDAPEGPFSDDSPSQTVAAETRFTLDGHAARYYVLWITNLGTFESVHVNEVTAR